MKLSINWSIFYRMNCIRHSQSFIYVFVFVILFFSGCKKETIILPSPKISITSIEIKDLTSYLFVVKIDKGERQKILKAELILEDITVNSMPKIVEEIKISENRIDSVVIPISTNRLSHDYCAKVVLQTDNFSYFGEEKIVRSLKNDFDLQVNEDNFYYDPTGEFAGFFNQGQRIPLMVKYLNIYHPHSIAFRLNGKININGQLYFDSSITESGYLTSFGDAFVPQIIDPGEYEISVLIDGLEFKGNKKIKVLKGQWRALESKYPGESRGQYSWFVLGDKLYLVGGSYYVTTINYSPVWEYNLKTKVWTQKKNFPYPFDQNNMDNMQNASILPFQIQNGGSGYILMCNGQIVELWKYLPEVDNWLKISDYPGKGELNLTGFVLGDKLYIGGGIDNEFLQFGSKFMSDFWCFDFNLKNWIRKGNLPFSPIVGYFPACSLQDKGYVLQTNRAFWQYNSLADNWVQSVTFPGLWRFSSQLISDGQNLYLLGGESELPGLGGYTIVAKKDVWKYSPSVNAWEMQAFLPDFSSNGIAFLYQGKIAMGLGYLINGSYLSKDSNRLLYEFSPTNN